MPNKPKNEITETQEIQEVTATDTGTFRIVGAQEKDAEGSDQWKQYLSAEALLDAYAPPADSPFARFMKTKTIRSIGAVGAKIQPRYSGGEKKSEQELVNLFQSEKLGKNTAVFLDSGGAHSVAMGVKLAEHGYQPIITFDAIPHSNASNSSEQELAAMLYYAEKIKRTRERERVKMDAGNPPVFIMDCHRDSKPMFKGEGKIDNSYSFASTDLPSAAELRKQGITRVVYLNEGDQHGKFRIDFQSTDRLPSDLKPIFQEWINAGIEVLYTGIAPWERDVDSERQMFRDLFGGRLRNPFNDMMDYSGQ